jgi:uncharacterized protein (TIGR04255 family)
MKKILSYDAKSLDSFIVSFNYEKDIIGIEANKVSPLSEEIGKVYPKMPFLGLLKRRFTEVNLGYLRYLDEDEKNYVDVGSDFLVFIFKKYTRWTKELEKIIHVFKALKDYVEVLNITRIVLTYVDIFHIPTDEFVFNRYFTFPLFSVEDSPFANDIKYHDINLGFVPNEYNTEKDKRKLVVRIKSRPQEIDNYVFRLETVGSIDEFSMAPEISLIKEYLNYCHDRIIDTFLTILTSDYKEELDLRYE